MCRLLLLSTSLQIGYLGLDVLLPRRNSIQLQLRFLTLSWRGLWIANEREQPSFFPL